jgi:hypothetical protein
MKHSLLANLLLVDAALLLLLGAALVFVPTRVEMIFGFENLPAGVSYILGLWGVVLVTMGLGYVVAASDPIRHLVWVQMGIARGALECVLGAVCLARGIVGMQQAGFGIALAALITIAYLVTYPRAQKNEESPIQPAADSQK